MDCADPVLFREKHPHVGELLPSPEVFRERFHEYPQNVPNFRDEVITMELEESGERKSLWVMIERKLASLDGRLDPGRSASDGGYLAPEVIPWKDTPIPFVRCNEGPPDSMLDQFVWAMHWRDFPGNDMLWLSVFMDEAALLSRRRLFVGLNTLDRMFRVLAIAAIGGHRLLARRAVHFIKEHASECSRYGYTLCHASTSLRLAILFDVMIAPMVLRHVDFDLSMFEFLMQELNDALSGHAWMYVLGCQACDHISSLYCTVGASNARTWICFANAYSRIVDGGKPSRMEARVELFMSNTMHFVFCTIEMAHDECIQAAIEWISSHPFITRCVFRKYGSLTKWLSPLGFVVWCMDHMASSYAHGIAPKFAVQLPPTLPFERMASTFSFQSQERAPMPKFLLRWFDRLVRDAMPFTSQNMQLSLAQGHMVDPDQRAKSLSMTKCAIEFVSEPDPLSMMIALSTYNMSDNYDSAEIDLDARKMERPRWPQLVLFRERGLKRVKDVIYVEPHDLYEAFAQYTHSPTYGLWMPARHSRLFWHYTDLVALLLLVFDHAPVFSTLWVPPELVHAIIGRVIWEKERPKNRWQVFHWPAEKCFWGCGARSMADKGTLCCDQMVQ